METVKCPGDASHRPVFQEAAILAIAIMAALLVSPARAADIVEAHTLFRSGKYAECIELTGRVVGAGAPSENWPLIQIRAEMAVGRYRDAAKSLTAALARFPQSIQLRWLGREVWRFNGDTKRADQSATEIGELARQAPWRYRDAANQVTLGRFFLSQAVDPKKVLNDIYDQVKKEQPNYVEAYLASGELALEKNDYALAAESFEQAIKIDDGEPAAHFGLARAFAPSEPEKARQALAAALAINPNHIGSLLALVDDHIDAERYDEATNLLDRADQINRDHPLAWAYRAVLAHLNSQPEREAECRAAALKWWPTNPEVDCLIGAKLARKYRFAEAAEYQRRALALDGGYQPAKIELAQDLLRLGDEDAGWPLADAVYTADAYHVVAHNLVTLQESLAKFRTLERDGLVLRMDAREAEVYGAAVLDLLGRARQRLCEKYEVTIDEPVIVELFPHQQDFAIRTFGLPGGAGFLGVCFGRVITANSPASQGEHPSNWQATLWHEFCHVVTLHKTHNKMPRWLSEGISVYEERQANATWGQTINPRYREMMLGDKLTPVSQLSGAFLHPRTPLDLQFAYYESSLVVEYLIDQHGVKTLNRVLTDLGAGMPINDSLARYAGSLEALDQQFAAYAHQRAEQMAPKADWSDPNLPDEADEAVLAAFAKEHPHNYAALGRLARRRIADRQWEAARGPLETMTRLYPEDCGATNPWSLLATVYRQTGNTAAERTALERLAALSDDDMASFTRLAELAAERADWPAALDYARRLLAVNPLLPAPHRAIARAAEETGERAAAIDAWRALLLLAPIDPAEIHYRLATLLHQAGDLPRAKRHALQALEEAPRYRAAQRELLAIIDDEKPKDQPGNKPDDADGAADGVISP
jgi:tetratricopeptide (TPR) repeat protein